MIIIGENKHQYFIEDYFQCKYRTKSKKKPKKIVYMSVNILLIKTKKQLNEVFNDPFLLRCYNFFNYLAFRKKLEYDPSPDKWLEANRVLISKNDKDLMGLCNNSPNMFYKVVNYLVDNEYLLKPCQGWYFLSPQYVDMLNKGQLVAMKKYEQEKFLERQSKFFEAYMAKKEVNK